MSINTFFISQTKLFEDPVTQRKGKKRGGDSLMKHSQSSENQNCDVMEDFRIGKGTKIHIMKEKHVKSYKHNKKITL